MAIRTWILLSALFVGSLAFPTLKDEGDLSQFFETSGPGAQGRIVGGRPAPIGAHPWLVAITHGGVARTLLCGSSLLNRRTVLTAAHCIDELRVGNNLRHDVRLHAGTNFYNSGGQTLTVRGFGFHNRYNPNGVRNDIATIFAAGLFQLNHLVQPVALDFSVVGGGVSARAAGWGSTTVIRGPSSQRLLEVDLPTITNAECNQMLRRAGSFRVIDTVTEMCAFRSTGTGVCSGDSGSPLMRLDRNQQVGIVSWTHRQCANGGPDMYVRVSGYRDWIQQNTQAE